MAKQMKQPDELSSDEIIELISIIFNHCFNQEIRLHSHKYTDSYLHYADLMEGAIKWLTGKPLIDRSKDEAEVDEHVKEFLLVAIDYLIINDEKISK